MEIPRHLQGKRLTESGAFAPQYREAVVAAARAVKTPELFFVDIEERESGRIYVLHLWHESAFLPENRGMNGNPGGQCRDVHFDTTTKTILKIAFWQ